MARRRVHVDIITDTKGSVESLAKYAAATGIALVAVKKLLDVGQQLISDYEEEERQNIRLRAALRATNNQVGISATEMGKLAGEMSRATGIEDNLITNTQALLVTFTQIGGEVFPRALSAAADMSAMFGTQLNQSVIQLGKALNDPIIGVGALREIGISFTEQQKESIEMFIDQNDVMGAQTVILDELEREFGGVAEAMGETTEEGNSLTNSIRSLREELGALASRQANPIRRFFRNFVDDLTEATRARRILADVMSGANLQPLAGESTVDAIARLNDEMDKLVDRHKELQAFRGASTVQDFIDREQLLEAIPAIALAIEELEALVVVQEELEEQTAETTEEIEAMDKRISGSWKTGVKGIKENFKALTPEIEAAKIEIRGMSDRMRDLVSGTEAFQLLEYQNTLMQVEDELANIQDLIDMEIVDSQDLRNMDLLIAKAEKLRDAIAGIMNVDELLGGGDDGESVVETLESLNDVFDQLAESGIEQAFSVIGAGLMDVKEGAKQAKVAMTDFVATALRALGRYALAKAAFSSAELISLAFPGAGIAQWAAVAAGAFTAAVVVETLGRASVQNINVHGNLVHERNLERMVIAGGRASQ